MKYLNTRTNYITKINETFVNEITFGGSLLGRLINSIIRKAKIGINYTKVESIAEDIKKELDLLVAKSLDVQNKNKLSENTYKYFLTNIYDVVISESSDEEKINQLLGKDDTEGLIAGAIKWIEISPLEDKDILISKLNKFKLDLEKLKPKEKQDETPTEIKKEPTLIGTESKKLTSLLEFLPKSGSQPVFKTFVTHLLSQEKMTYSEWLSKSGQKSIGSEPEVADKEQKTFVEWLKGYSKNIDSKNIMLSPKEISFSDWLNFFKNSVDKDVIRNIDTKKYKSFIDWLLTYNNTKTNESKENLITSYIKFKIINENYNDRYEDAIVVDDDNEEEVSDKTNDNSENTQDVDTVKSYWYENFEKGEESEWKINEEEIKKNDISDPEIEVDTTEEETKDGIIKIANLFGKAYKLFAVHTIPSGRPAGRISNKTYNEYTYIGTGESKSNNKDHGPGYGPWVSKAVFEKFTNIISNYIEYDKYKAIFNYGKIKRTDGTFLKGNVLLEFIRNMIDENSLKNYSKNRSILLNKYFGLKQEINVNKDEFFDPKTEQNKAIKIYWNDISPINESKNSEVGSFIAINCLNKSGGHQTLIGHILRKNTGKMLLKFQFGNESLPISHGNKISADYKWAKRIDPDSKVYIGMIDLNNTPIIENNPFKLAWRQVDIKNPEADTNYSTHIYTPSVKVRPSGTLARQDNKRPMAVLTSDDKEGNRIPIIVENAKKSKEDIRYDINVNLDAEFVNAENKLKQS